MGSNGLDSLPFYAMPLPILSCHLKATSMPLPCHLHSPCYLQAIAMAFLDLFTQHSSPLPCHLHSPCYLMPCHCSSSRLGTSMHATFLRAIFSSVFTISPGDFGFTAFHSQEEKNVSPFFQRNFSVSSAI